jgi:enamine deaminase RidA (YjgF/YER057c/UK114 family)
MGHIEQRLQELDLRLPEPFAPAGKEFNFSLVTIHGGLAYIAGHGPFDGTTPLVQGRLGDDLSVEQGYEAARLTGLGILASLKQELGSLDRVTQWLRAVGYVHAAPGFDQGPLVVNGFSDLIVELWGDAGRHARTSPGLAATPSNVPILIDAIVAVE